MTRTAALRGPGGVCRSLFGPVDHDQLSRDLKRRLGDMSEQDARRWNFDFRTDTPRPGRYQWEEVPSHCSAALYRESVPVEEDGDDDAQSDYSAEVETTEADEENRSSISNTPKLPSEVTPVRRKRTLSKQTAKPPKDNARITDFFVKRRRTSETKDIQNPFLTSSSEPTLCKRIR